MAMSSMAIAPYRRGGVVDAQLCDRSPSALRQCGSDGSSATLTLASAAAFGIGIGIGSGAAWPAPVVLLVRQQQDGYAPQLLVLPHGVERQLRLLHPPHVRAIDHEYHAMRLSVVLLPDGAHTHLAPQIPKDDPAGAHVHLADVQPDRRRDAFGRDPLLLVEKPLHLLQQRSFAGMVQSQYQHLHLHLREEYFPEPRDEAEHCAASSTTRQARVEGR
eukprot:CAMPEP_0119483010 /NCGR_PEP_ID=MMETSP1344-20130328/10611_1 /TAXON_ID=236787 /ORGANISM="Florenciella parvula, Strain CCMP2471" /LENGTH=216 /DNA_ID=CAMNT_0007517467 /DNA_START=174 /DNA_END=826 /DNA_ORIENTATION=+